MIKKKRIKDSYIVRAKKRILRDTVDSEAKYTTTFKDIRNYFKYLTNLYLKMHSTLLIMLKLKEL